MIQYWISTTIETLSARPDRIKPTDKCQSMERANDHTFIGVDQNASRLDGEGGGK